jgi:hypothetical protein
MCRFFCRKIGFALIFYRHFLEIKNTFCNKSTSPEMSTPQSKNEPQTLQDITNLKNKEKETEKDK